MISKRTMMSYVLYLLVLILMSLGFYWWASLCCLEPVLTIGETLTPFQIGLLSVIGWTGVSALLMIDVWSCPTKTDRLIMIGSGILYLLVIFCLLSRQYRMIYQDVNVVEANVSITYFISGILTLIPYLVIGDMLVHTQKIDWWVNLILIGVLNFFVPVFLVLFNHAALNQLAHMTPEIYLGASVAGALSFAYGYYHQGKHNLYLIIGILLGNLLLYYLNKEFGSEIVIYPFLIMRFLYPILLSFGAGWFMQKRNEVSL